MIASRKACIWLHVSDCMNWNTWIGIHELGIRLPVVGGVCVRVVCGAVWWVEQGWWGAVWWWGGCAVVVCGVWWIGTILTVCFSKSAYPLSWHIALWSPVPIFFASVTVPLQLEVSKLNVNMVTCNGCNGCVTVYVTVDVASCTCVCACVK